MKSRREYKRFSTGRRALAVIFLVAGFFAVSTIGPVPTSQATSRQTRAVPESFTALAEQNSPAVVNIRAERSVGQAQQHFRGGPSKKDDPLRDFFDKFFGGRPGREFKQRGLGSGFIIEKDGYIVTNNHVVEGADKIKVILKNEKEFDAEIKGRDPNTDLALIKIEAEEDLPTVQLGDSDKLKVGEWVLTIGSPFGLAHTVTTGIISAKGRVIGSGPYDDFLQTDASINPGNSGGPLINMEGKVVGINTAIIAGGHGIGFAIPINLAKGIIAQLKSKGEVTRGWLGVGIQDLSKELKEYYKIDDGEGVLITQVFPGDPASEAGLEPKDIVLEVNGRKVHDSRELSRMIAEAGVGDKVRLLILRKGEEKGFTIELAKRKETRTDLGNTKIGREYEFGIKVSDLTPEIARQLNIQEDKGVVVVGVEPRSKGEEGNILPGDVIKEVNHKEVESVKEYTEEVRNVKPGEPVYLYVFRPNKGFMVIKLKK